MIESTENTPEDDSRVEDRAPPLDFGLELKQAREAAGLTIADVADELKLADSLIADLESAKVEDLPASTFTQGYLRNYARLLKLPSDDIVQAYVNQIRVIEPDLTPVSGVPAQKNSHDALVRITSYGLVVVAFLLMLLWWQQTDFDWDGIPVPESITAPETSSQPLELEPAPGTDAPDSGLQQPAEFAPLREQIQDEPDSTMDSTGDVSEGPAEDSPAMTGADTEPALPEMTDDEQPVEEVMQVAEQPEAVTAPVGDDVLVMTTESESWTEVNDATGSRLLFKLMRQGQQYRLQGRAPFRVFLGNAPTVRISVNDEPVDIAAYIRSNNIANIVIGAEAGVSANRAPRTEQKPANPVDSQESADDAVDTTDPGSSRDSIFENGR